MSYNGERSQPEDRPGRREPDRLLRAIDELRALDLQRRIAAASPASFRDLERRVEQKAREVFRIADDDDDVEGQGSPN